MKIVQDNKSLKTLCKNLKNQKIIYLDTEFIRDRTYWPLLCTIQIRTNRKSYLIDMISNQDMNFKQLKEILKNNNILKVIHSARQDVEVILYNFNLIIWPIFDTQLAYGLAYNENNIGYNAIAEKLLRIKLSKENQQSNWAHRPLSRSQINYAENDVKFLPEIYEIIFKEIKIKRKINKLKLETNKLKLIKDIFDIKNAYKKIKSKNLSNKELKMLKFITEWREKTAQKVNIPRNWVITDKLIMQVVKKKELKLEAKETKNKNFNSKIEDFSQFLKINKFI